MMILVRAALTVASWTLLLCTPTAAQTYTSCNPLTQTCAPDTALGKAIHVDFTKGSVDSFVPATGNPTYDSNGASFTIARPGDSPTLKSNFFIMFGKVSITMKTAPGAGIVSTLVLESDDLDEIDLEWLGADNDQVQTNYFGKGTTGSYDRGGTSAAPNNQGQFTTYTIEWTADQIVWSVGGNVVRVLTPATAEANQYPQTPMQIKFGAWSGGDPSNAPGVIQWARGPTDYSKGPFTMVVQSIDVADYSTGTQYKYNGNSGSWNDIVAVGGAVNGNKGSASSPVVVAPGQSQTTSPPTVGGFGTTSDGNENTKTGWPWVASPTTLQTVAATSAAAGVPSGWVISTSGKISPASTAATSYPTYFSSPAPSPSPSSPPTVVGGLDTITTWDDRGFLTTMTVPAGYQTMSKCFNEQGFRVACGAATTTDPPAAAVTKVQPQVAAQADSVATITPNAGSQNNIGIPLLGAMAIVAGFL